MLAELGPLMSQDHPTTTRSNPPTNSILEDAPPAATVAEWRLYIKGSPIQHVFLRLVGLHPGRENTSTWTLQLPSKEIEPSSSHVHHPIPSPPNKTTWLSKQLICNIPPPPTHPNKKEQGQGSGNVKAKVIGSVSFQTMSEDGAHRSCSMRQCSKFTRGARHIFLSMFRVEKVTCWWGSLYLYYNLHV